MDYSIFIMVAVVVLLMEEEKQLGPLCRSFHFLYSQELLCFVYFSFRSQLLAMSRYGLGKFISMPFAHILVFPEK
jgi:hypothetical protein